MTFKSLHLLVISNLPDPSEEYPEVEDLESVLVAVRVFEVIESVEQHHHLDEVVPDFVLPVP